MKSQAPPQKSLIDAIAEYYHGEWGFTGTRAGMSTYQASMTRRIFLRGQPIVLRHGGAFGSDFEAHGIWREVCKDSAANVWPADEKRAAIFRGQQRVKVEHVMDPLMRNEEIVKRSKLLVATPHTEQEEQRSGTWATIRCALKLNKPVIIIWPKSQRITLYYEKQLHRVNTTGA